MADLGLVTSKLQALPPEMRGPMLEILTVILRDLRMGHPKQEQPDPMMNFAGGFFTATTPSTPGEAFSLTHGFGRAPYLASSVLLLDTVGSQIVPLTVTQASDDKRIYLSSSTADAYFCLAVEG